MRLQYMFPLASHANPLQVIKYFSVEVTILCWGSNQLFQEANGNLRSQGDKIDGSCQSATLPNVPSLALSFGYYNQLGISSCE